MLSKQKKISLLLSGLLVVVLAGCGSKGAILDVMNSKNTEDSSVSSINNEPTGLTDEINYSENTPGLAIGFSQVANTDKPIEKYLLADNGAGYE